MTLLDRFRTPARDKHPDPIVRLAFVDELPLSEREAIAAVAREDDDARVRKAAVAKLLLPSTLAAIARDDRDEQVRTQAMTMLRDIALEVFEDAGEAESVEAVDAIADTRVLAQIAKGSTRETVALRAVSRIPETHVLGSVARHAAMESARRAAFDALTARADRAELLAVALNSDFKDTALAAAELVVDRADLEQIVARSKNKSAVKRARTVLREADERAAHDAAGEVTRRAAAEAIAVEVAVVEPPEELVSPPHGDPLAAQIDTPTEAELAETAARGEEEAAAQALAAVRAEAEAREAAERESVRRHARMTVLVEEAVATAAEQDFAAARKRFGALRREWQTLATHAEVAPDLASRFAALDGEMTAREREAQELDARTRREALARVHQLLARVEPMAEKGDVTLKAAERALRDIRTAQSAMPPLPSKQDFKDVSRRLKAAQTTLTPKVQELREADEWKRFANASVQEQLCARMEALKTVEDPETAAREVRELQTQWKAAAEVPRAQADTLWRRFKAAHDEVWTRAEAHFAAQAEQRAGNLARKVALCEKAEGLSESTAWIQTAEEIKTLQAEWKTIGPVSRGKEKAIWDRFRAACDRFFTRRHEDLAVRKASWTDNLAKKDALCARAEALAESTDWDAAAAEIKRLQAEWKTVGAVKKSKSEAIWQRFRAACDAFFARHALRHDTARAERVAAREALCAELEGLGTLEEAPTDLAATVRSLRSRWQQEITARGVDPDRARELDQRFGASFGALVSRWPQAFAGSDLDPEANRKRMETIVRRMEDLAHSLAGSKAADEALSPTNRLAAMLKEALAANTIGGKVEDDSRFRAAAEDVRQAQAAWAKVGLVPEDVRRSLSDRFQRALRGVNDRLARAKPAR